MAKHMFFGDDGETVYSEKQKKHSEQSHRDHLLIKPNVKWVEHEFKSDPVEACTLSQDEIDNLQTRASKLLEKDIELYKKKQTLRKSRTNYHFIHTAISSGTNVAKLAAMTELIQDSPVHNLSYVEKLLSMVNIKAKRECIESMRTLRDLFISDLLLEHRKLRTFKEQPLHKLNELASGNKDSLEKRLVIWYFEHQLQKIYAQFIFAVNNVSRDTVVENKRTAIKIMYELLVCSRDKEEILLPHLVNKIGDPHHTVATASVDHLIALTINHPDRKTVIMQEVERLLFRNNVSERAQYFSVCCLNQIRLTRSEKDLAARLLSIYFALFKALTKQNEVNAQMMKALLTGANRAYPYSKENDAKVQAHIDTLYKIVHTVSFNVSIQSLKLIHTVLDSQNALTDRFYSSLYRKLFSPEIEHTSQHALFFNLVYKSVLNDAVKSRVQAFLKRLLQICFGQQPPLICSILFTVSVIMKRKPNILLLEQDASQKFLDDDEEFRVAIKKERNPDTNDKNKKGNSLESSLVTKHKKKEVDLQGKNLKEKKKKMGDIQKKNLVAEDKSNQDGSSWFHQKNLPGGIQQKDGYDPMHRNPTYAGADHSCYWELVTLSRHYHPTVALFAQKLLNNELIDYSGDPMQDFTLINFLDRFVYRNPKVPPAGTKNESRHVVFGPRKFYIPAHERQIPVDSSQFTKRKEHKVPVDELFFYKYFKEKQTAPKKKKNEDDSDVESVQSEEFEDYLTKMEPNALGDDFELDFASEINKNKQKKKKGDESDSEEGLSDERDEFEDDEEFADAFRDYDDEVAEAKGMQFDEADMEFSDSDAEDTEENEEFSNEVSKLRGNKRKAKNAKGSSSKKQKFNRLQNSKFSGLFAAAEEFGTIMDENATSAVDTTSMNALANKDNADAKQLKWELQRDQWIRGKDWKSRKHAAGFKSNKKGGKLNIPKKIFKNKQKKRESKGFVYKTL